jgi:glutathionyl-hydroquinone reductase
VLLQDLALEVLATVMKPQFPAEQDVGCEFKRQQVKFRDWVTADGRSGYPAVPGRYHLYVTHIKQHYYMTHTEINPTRIVPLGPVHDLDAPHGREGL